MMISAAYLRYKSIDRVFKQCYSTGGLKLKNFFAKAVTSGNKNLSRVLFLKLKWGHMFAAYGSASFAVSIFEMLLSSGVS